MSFSTITKNHTTRVSLIATTSSIGKKFHVRVDEMSNDRVKATLMKCHPIITALIHDVVYIYPSIAKKTPKASEMSPFIPKIPAPRRDCDTTPLLVSTLLEHCYKKLESSSRRKRLFLKFNNANTTHQAQVFPSSIAATKELHIMGNEQKGKVLKWHQKMSF
jgi:hypothetical protein